MGGRADSDGIGDPANRCLRSGGFHAKPAGGSRCKTSRMPATWSATRPEKVTLCFAFPGTANHGWILHPLSHPGSRSVSAARPHRTEYLEMTTNILVTFSSTYDHVHQMALAVAEGAERGRALPAGRGHEGTPPNSAGLVSTLREF